jgi:hypothetical protein
MTRTPKLPDDEIPDPLIIAAIERAERHRATQDPGVHIWAITEHLDIARRSASARYIRSRLQVLAAAGSLERLRSHGIDMWALTRTGSRRLRSARLAREVPELPESPQHRAWRNARTVAAQEIERLRRALRDSVEDATELLDAHTAAASDTWFELGERLQRSARRIGSASYCLYEWLEPDEDRADVDDRSEPGDEQLEEPERARRRARRAGRRNLTLWRDGQSR